ncbi:ComEC/Rec2 family competence protein [Arthrospiribacter ruber]|uniref:ComEC family competence protein n=1 Tax=Arthrospiribacter ruber TaxID=2487934 RepID=A0A951J0V9_9BACT|nr:ComEC/Rec2 family competence protein [Arthrospiribacter ruber]MBW3469879.1 ComEC family competence protein [Arthrospiribacter ruber]
MIFSEFPFLRYVFFLILGIIAYPYLAFFPPSSWIYGLAFFFMVYSFLIWSNKIKKVYLHKVWIPVLAAIQLVFLGLFLTGKNDLRNREAHIVNLEKPILAYMALVLDQDEPKPNSIANRLKIKRILTDEGWVRSDGEIIAYHRSEEGMKSGEVILVKGSPEEIAAPTVPFEFDYRTFMRRQKITHQHFVGTDFARIGFFNEYPVHQFFAKVRASVMGKLDQKIHNPQAAQVAKALLLGQKKNLEKEVSEAYATAGAMHILAVSGLHVGIIYGFFFLFIKPYRLKKVKRIGYLSFIIVLIWVYALLTGMSPSVMRAATMFTLMALAQMKSRSPSIFNAIALSAFVLLVFDPDLIYSVGFQLSYVALIGIIVFQPLIVRLWIPKYPAVEYLWQITAVGIAAQLATFPISAYYFHTFPVYFMISNLIAIPGAFLIMCFGVPMMLLADVPLISQFLSLMTEYCILSVNLVVFWIQDLPYSRVREIYLPGWKVFMYWILLSLVFMAFYFRKKHFSFMTVGALTLFLVLRLVFFFQDNSRNELVFVRLPQGVTVDYWKGNSLYHYSELDDKTLGYKIIPYRSRSGAKKIYPLVALSYSSDLILAFPNQKMPTFSPGLDLEFKREDARMVWKNGQWISVGNADSLQQIPSTHKILF